MIQINNKNTIGKTGMKLTKSRGLHFKDNISLFILIMPALICLILFNYMPMFGSILAFKDYRYNLGIFGSDWVGLENFKYFFTSNDALIVIRNTLAFNVVFILCDVFFGVAAALLLYGVKRRIYVKYLQTTMLLPHFMSWVIISYITYALMDPVYGVFYKALGIDKNWYTTLEVWPAILILCHVWKNIGMKCIFYYAALLGIDETLYEAAKIDGANKWQQIKAITIPELRSIICILVILGVGSIFKGDFGLFYNVPMDVGVLYPVTDVIDTYVFRGLRSGDIGVNAAVGFVQSVVGLLTVLASNAIVKKIDEDSAMF